MKRIYFDNAATTYPKPEAVYRALNEVLRECGGNPGRAGHSLSMLAGRRVYECREEIAELMGVRSPERVVFFGSATQALNTAIKGLAKDGMHILISSVEHNSVLRPVHALAKKGRCEYGVFEASADTRTLLQSIEKNRKKNTKLLVMNHRSNLFPLTLDAEAVGKYCRERGIAFVLDASQSAGAVGINAERIGAQAICFAGHKALYGIQGVGVALIGEGVEPSSFATLVEGGSGVDSLDPEMPSVFPERLEAGTLPLGPIASLAAGVRHVRALGLENIEERERKLGKRAIEIISQIRGASILRPELGAGSVVSFNIKGFDSEELARRLDLRGICCRAGLHCAPLAHKSAGSAKSGALRLSFGIYNTEKELEYLARALSDCLNE